MGQFFEFIGNHPFLFIIFLTVSGLLIWDIFGEMIKGIRSLSPQEVIQLINREDAVVVDVRDYGEFEAGHILNAVHIPISQFNEKLQKLEKYRHRPLILNCMTGNRSAIACKTLKSNGFTKIYSLKGGLPAWQEASLPLIKGKA